MQKKLPIIIKYLLILIGAVVLFYGIGVAGYVQSSGWFKYFLVIVGAGIIGVAFLVPAFFRAKLWIKIPISAIIIAVIINFAVVEINIIKGANRSPADDAKWVIVLGARVNYSGISLEFRTRIDGALEYAEAHPDCIIVTTGCKGSDEPQSEGEAARDYLLSSGIEENRILVENTSTDTDSNLTNAMEIMKAAGYKEGDGIVIVSSSFHIYRASLIVDKLGFENVSYIGRTGLHYLVPFYFIREYGSLLLDWL